MRIITISRQFGSGGRELGKRLADMLGYDYYDRQIITAIAEEGGLNRGYVDNAVEERAWMGASFNFRQSISMSAEMQQPHAELLRAQSEVIESVLGAGRSCVIVGRNADVFLAKENPFKIFVCADLDARIDRCIERAAEGERLSRKQVEQNIRRVDKNRARTREMIASGKWGDSTQYNITVNTTGWEIKDLTPAIAEIALRWFLRNQ